MTVEPSPCLSAAAEAPVAPELAFGLRARFGLEALCEAARTRRDRAFGRRLTFSPKVFLPLTNLCRNFCDYCSFRRSPGDAGAWTMSRAELDDWLERGRVQGASEALFCLGDRPESVFHGYRRTLAQLGHGSTVDYLVEACQRALSLGLLPHTNAGLLTHDELLRLRPLNVSMGLMLESSSERLCGRGMVHHRAPDKRPGLRLAMMRDAGALNIAFTSGILLGIGETAEERLETLLALRDLHAQYGHLQEVIVQRFRSHPETPMAAADEPDDLELRETIALARLLLPDEVSVQSPPNLSPGMQAQLIDAGIDDFGGISPVTPDYINPRHPWPHLDALRAECARHGFQLTARLPVYARFATERFVDPQLLALLPAVCARIAAFDVSRACT